MHLKVTNVKSHPTCNLAKLVTLSAVVRKIDWINNHWPEMLPEDRYIQTCTSAYMSKYMYACAYVYILFIQVVNVRTCSLHLVNHQKILSSLPAHCAV